MGKIKSKGIKRSAEVLVETDIVFDKEFEKNKKILGNEIPSKKMRNQLAGYLVRLKKNQEKKEKELKAE